MKSILSILCLCWLFVLAACRPAQAGTRINALPTLLPSPTAPIDIEAAQQAAMNFLDAWHRFDYETMYGLVSFASQEAVAPSGFTRNYEDSRNLMTLVDMTFTPRSLYRESDRVVVLLYDVAFQTDLMGTFSDTDRQLRLILDPVYHDWRVAWSPGDIFPEMGNGAVLRFESRIPSRANIYDRDGEVLADQNGIVVRINVIKDDMPDPAVCIAALASATGRDPSFIQDLFDRSGQNWVIDAGFLEPQAYNERSAQLERDCAATFARQAVRRYPRGSLLPHVLGNVGYPDESEVTDLIRAGFNAETIIGKSGIERSWDTTLRGQPGGRLVLVAPNGNRLRLLAEVSSRIPESLWLTIDADLQEYVLRSIGEAYIESSATWGQTSKGGAAIIMNVNNGEVLSLVSWPTYEGNAFTPFPAVGQAVARAVQTDVIENPANPLLNRATLGQYPTGSTMKIVPAVAALDSNVYAFEQTYVSTGRWQRGNDLRFDWLGGGHGRVTLAGALTHSCNTCFYEVGFLLNERDPFLLPSYGRRMGLGVLTGIRDIPELPGNVPDPDWMSQNRLWPWNSADAVNLAIGQGEVDVTPLQLARLYAGVANGGILYRPLLVRETGILDQRTFVAQPDINGRFDIRPDVLDFLRPGLCDVITQPWGTASHIFRNSPLLSVGVCAKTGTAQTPGVGSQPHSWFVAYAPADDPEIVVLVMIENAGDGSAIAAPITRRIMEYYFFGPFE